MMKSEMVTMVKEIGLGGEDDGDVLPIAEAGMRRMVICMGMWRVRER